MSTTTSQQDTDAMPAMIIPLLSIVRWIAAVPAIIYGAATCVAALAGLGALGWSGLTQTPALTIWMTVLGGDKGRNWFDLVAVFFERKLTLVLFDYPIIGEQLWWWWINPAFKQTPVIWAGIAVGWWGLWLALGFLGRKAREANDMTID